MRRAFAQSSLDVMSLDGDVTLIRGAGGNVVTIDGPDGSVMVDAGLAEHAAELIELVTERSSANHIAALINTHWHLDHTGANDALGAAGTPIVAHEYTKQWMKTEIHVEWQQRTYAPRRPEAVPTETFMTDGRLAVGGETLEYGYLPRGHTDGDLYVLLPRANVLVAGDVVSAEGYPIIDYSTGGWLGELLDSTEILLEIADEHTRIVPGTGPLLTREDVAAQRDMLETVYDRMRVMMRRSLSTEEMLDAGITEEFDARWGDPKLFVANAHHAMAGYFRELRIA